MDARRVQNSKAAKVVSKTLFILDFDRSEQHLRPDHAECSAEYCEMDRWRFLMQGLLASSPGNVTVRPSRRRGTLPSRILRRT